MLKNSTIAEKIGISNIYSFYKKTNEYASLNHDKLNAELLHHDVEKLGVTQHIILNTLSIYYNCLNQNCFLNDLFDSNYNINASDCKKNN